MKNSIIMILLVLVIPLLQVFLSKAESRWPGLLLPILSFGYSILAVFGAAVYMLHSVAEVAVLIISILFTANIPTLILLAIYFAVRNRTKGKRELDKMNIQDLS